jgi:hypothetical protein
MNMRAEGIHMINGMKKDEIMNGNRVNTLKTHNLFGGI